MRQADKKRDETTMTTTYQLVQQAERLRDLADRVHTEILPHQTEPLQIVVTEGLILRAWDAVEQAWSMHTMWPVSRHGCTWSVDPEEVEWHAQYMTELESQLAL